MKYMVISIYIGLVTVVKNDGLKGGNSFIQIVQSQLGTIYVLFLIYY